MANTHKTVTIKSTNEEQQIVYGEVYAPYILDSYGDMMLPEDIEKMAHSFIAKGEFGGVIDTEHNNLGVDAYPVESFIARADDPNYTEGAWVVGVKIEDSEVWESVKKGEFNGFSMEALVIKKRAIANIETYIDNVGETDESSGHKHMVFVELDEMGKVVSGKTSTVDGHFHTITKSTATDESLNHTHRYFI